MQRLMSWRTSAGRLLADIPARAEGQELSRNALALFVALSLMNASNYLFHVIVSRAMGPASYGALSSLARRAAGALGPAERPADNRCQANLDPEEPRSGR